MTLTYRNVKSLKYIFLNVINAYVLTKLNCASDLSSRRSEVIPLTFTIIVVRYLRNWIYDCSVYSLVVECGMKILRLQKNFMRIVFFLCCVAIYKNIKKN